MEAFKQQEGNMRLAGGEAGADALKQAIDAKNPKAKMVELFTAINMWKGLTSTYDLMREFKELTPFNKTIPLSAPSSEPRVAARSYTVVAKKEYLKIEAQEIPRQKRRECQELRGLFQFGIPG